MKIQRHHQLPSLENLPQIYDQVENFEYYAEDE